jgi:hypothetical protein
MNSARRQWLVGFSSLSAGAMLIGCNKLGTSASNEPKDEKENGEAEVTATEDLLREHGILLVFPEWKETLNAKELDEMNEKFEDIEHQQFGEDGFENALKQIAEIEQSLGLSDLAQFTAPPPTAG